MPMYLWQNSALASPPVFTSGRRYNPSGTSNAGAAMTANRLYLWVWRIDRPVRISSLGILNNSAVVGNARLGLYNAPAILGGDGAKLREGASDISTNVGLTSLSDSITAIDLAPGFYCGASCFDAAANVYHAAGNTPACSFLMGVLGDTLPVATIGSGGCQFFQTAAVTYTVGSAFMPATLGALTRQNGAPGSPVMDFGVA